MPRKRMIWPNFFKSKQLAKVSIEAERTYEAVWCYGDDRGRIEEDAAEIWSEAWMTRRSQVSIDDVQDHFDALVSNGQLCRYAVGESSFLHTISWDEHQSINHPTRSKLPPCQKHQPAEWSMWWKDDDTATERWRAAEKALRSAKSTGVANGGTVGVTTGVPDSVEMPGQGVDGTTGVTTGDTSGVTTSQISSVQVRKDQGQFTEDYGIHPRFVRKSLGGTA